MPDLPPQSQADKEFIDTVKPSLIAEFRDSIYTRRYLDKNAKLFLDNNWIVATDLREFIDDKSPSFQSDEITLVASSSPPISRSSSPSISQLQIPERRVVKVEEDLDRPTLADSHVDSVCTRTISENGNEVTEILSDSEEEHTGAQIKTEHRSYFENHGFDNYQTIEWEISDTNWEVPDKHSMVCMGVDLFRITDCESADRPERLDFLPPAWPIPKISTAFLLDLSDPKHEFYDNGGRRLGPDYLLRKKDNDSWETQSTGSGDSQVWVRFEPDQDKILCHRVRLKCKGVCACAQVNQKLLQVERRELDTSTRDAVFAAQEKARQEGGTTQRSAVLTFLDVVNSKKCCARDSHGDPCAGKQIMIPIKESNDDYFFGCNGWKPTFQKNHSTHSIPRSIDRTVLAHVVRTGELPLGLKHDSPPCSTIVHPSTGLKQKTCAAEHVQEGRSFRPSIVRYPYHARSTIFVPVDSTIRKALVVHRGNTPHNHPVPPFLKLGLDDIKDYTACVVAAGSVGATVQRVDSASSTAVILNGQTPAERAPGLQNGRKRRDLLHKVKLKRNPAGLGLAGAANLYFRDQEQPVQDRYVHRYVTLSGGGLVIFTAYAELLALIHEVTSFQADTTFKRISDSVNELEFVIFYKPAQRAITIARVYVNRADTEHFKLVFNMLQEVVLEVTGRPMRFKRLSSGGNLLVMNSDMEAAQILGAGLSFLPTNEPDYSSISTDEPDIMVQYFLKLCLVHFKRGILDLKSLLPQADYQRLMSLPSLKSKAELDDFESFIVGLKEKKVSDWWAHKTMHKWILPCIIRSQSKINPEDWDATPDETNTGEAQHHWTNKMTGIGLTIVDGIESARIADDSVRRSLNVTRQTGSLTNTHNEYHHRVSRNTTRRSTAAQNARDHAEEADAAAQLQAELKGLQEEKKRKQAELKALRASVPARKGRKPKALDSSSGRVPSAQPSQTHSRSATASPQSLNVSPEDVDVGVHDDGCTLSSQPSASVFTELNVSGTVSEACSIQLMDTYVPPLDFTQGPETKSAEVFGDEEFKAMMGDPDFLAMLNDNTFYGQVGMDEIGGPLYDLSPDLQVPQLNLQTTRYEQQFTLPPVPESLPPSPSENRPD